MGDTLAGNHSFQGLINFQGLQEKMPGNMVNVIAQIHWFRDLQNQNSFYYLCEIGKWPSADEPCQGLDAAQTAIAIARIDQYCGILGQDLS